MSETTPPVPTVSLALQGGSTHGAFTWGVLDRLLEEVGADRLRLSAISGTSAGALNAVVAAAGLMDGGADLARARLEAFWRDVSRRGALAGNALFGFAEPGLFGWNIDWNPVAIALEAAGLVVSPYTNPFYGDALGPLLEAALPGDTLARLNAAPGPRLFLTAVNVSTNARRIFSQGELSTDALRASACLPTEFKTVSIDGVPYWDGGYVGNPALSPLMDVAGDVLLVMVNPLDRPGMPPTGARGILDRLNEITFNASVVLEMDGIATVNRILDELEAAGTPYAGRYRRVNLHLIRNDRFTAQLGVVSKNSTSWPFLSALHRAGRDTADAWLRENAGHIGQRSTADVKDALTRPVLGTEGAPGR